MDDVLVAAELAALVRGLVALDVPSPLQFINGGTNTTVKEISATVIRKSDNARLSLIWATFPSPVYRNVAGSYETSFETAHPFKVEADTLAPTFVEFSNVKSSMDETTNKILMPVVQASSLILSQPGIDVTWADSQVKQLNEYREAQIALNDLFFWKADKFETLQFKHHPQKGAQRQTTLR